MAASMKRRRGALGKNVKWRWCSGILMDGHAGVGWKIS